MKSRITAVSMAVLGALLIGSVVSGSAYALTSAQSGKIKIATATYAKALSKAHARYLTEVNPSRRAFLVAAKKAEVVRRTKVKTAMNSFNAVAVHAKAPVLAAEKAYASAVTKSAASPENVRLKTEAKSRLTALNLASASLHENAKVVAARVAIAKARVSAMAAFKSTLRQYAGVSARATTRATANFKAAKLKAIARLNVAIKAAKSTR
ncbi:MAG TPA: hypothetical protein VMV52_01490 [Candidatus Nanopelagicaceae bacterium]|nr:hypothetical protein [Candidatus Nanopelagicaceae bacterium]